jgi:hypothetical protein
MTAEGARYEISVDGTVRTHWDALDIALEAANVLKACNPHSKVVVRDLTTGQNIEFVPSDSVRKRI